MNYDTGAAVTAFPRGFGSGAIGNGQNYRTATGEFTPDYGGLRITGTSENEASRRITGRLADVHKTLASASKCASFGRNGWIGQGGGYLIPDDSALSWKIKKMVERKLRRRRTTLFRCMRKMEFTTFISAWTGRDQALRFPARQAVG